METQKLTTDFTGHKVEITFNLPSGFDRTYLSIPCSISDHIYELIELGVCSGTYQDLPDDNLDYNGQGEKLSGSWRILDLSYDLVYRLVMWWNNHYTTDDLNRELFIKHFGDTAGNHYYSKWLECNENLLDMFGCFVAEHESGQTFCNMIMELVEQYESSDEAK